MICRSSNSAPPGAAAAARTAALFAAACVLLPAVAQAASPAFKAKYRAAFALYEKKEYESALRVFEEAVAIEADPLAVYSVGRCHHLLKRPAEAIAWYDRFLADAPGHEIAAKVRGYAVQAWAEVGHAKLAGGDAAGAVTAFETALARAEAEDAELLDALASAHEAASDRTRATAALERALAAAKTPALKARVEARLGALRAADVADATDTGSGTGTGTGGGTGGGSGSGTGTGTGTGTGSGSGTGTGTGTGTGSGSGTAALAPPAAPDPAPRKRTPVALWLGVGGGALLLAAGITALVWVVATPPSPWVDVERGLPTDEWVFDFGD